jgi:hypothetical protein
MKKSDFNVDIAKCSLRHLTRAWQGVVFDNYGIAKELAEKTTTKSGLMVKTHFNDKIYETGKTTSQEFLQEMPVEFNKVLPK